MHLAHATCSSVKAKVRLRHDALTNATVATDLPSSSLLPPLLRGSAESVPIKFSGQGTAGQYYYGGGGGGEKFNQ